MNERFGKPLMERESSGAMVVVQHIMATMVSLACVIGAVYIFFFMETEAAWASYLISGVVLVLGVFFFMANFAIGKTHAILYETGLYVANGKKNASLHFDEIVGLSDTEATDITVTGGLVGVLVASAVVAVAGKIVDAHNRKHRIREMNVWFKDNGELKSLTVIKSVGDVLSQLYTEWLITQKTVTAENIDNLVLPFAKDVELNKGVLTHGKVSLPFRDVTQISFEENNIHLLAINEKGKERSAIVMGITEMYNLDLFYYIYEMLNGAGKNTEEV